MEICENDIIEGDSGLYRVRYDCSDHMTPYSLSPITKKGKWDHKRPEIGSFNYQWMVNNTIKNMNGRKVGCVKVVTKEKIKFYKDGSE